MRTPRLTRSLRGGLALLAFSACGLASAETTVLYNDQVITVEQTLPAPNDLWVTPTDMTRINGFELKPEGACLDDICIPIRQDRDNDMVVTRSEQQWINLTGLADKLQQAYVSDYDNAVWSFGELPNARYNFLNNAEAPDFTMQDRNGKTVSLADFRGKKVFLGTWASW